MLPQNLVDLISLSERIMVGEVVSLTDGLDADGLPYTEVSVRVEDSLLGDNGSSYTFRQFGLLQPRQMPDGQTNLQVTPQGWPQFSRGEEIMLFLYKEASVSGLQTTVGLFQGKFNIVDGQITNEIGNANLFHRVNVDLASLSAQDRALVSSRGSRPADEFISFVRRAIDERWVEEGRMVHAQ